jgi:hypothetical protein
VSKKSPISSQADHENAENDYDKYQNNDAIYE